MTRKDKLLSQIINYYLDSYDCNGCTADDLDDFNKSDLEQLILEQKAFILSGQNNENIYINCLNSYGSPEDQIKKMNSPEMYAIYPSKKILESVDIKEEKPFSKMLKQGNEQFKVLYFGVEIMEQYVNDPRYYVFDMGFMGTVSSTLSEEELDQSHVEYVKNFGIAYPTNGPRDKDRAIAVFLRDVSKLNYEGQIKWRSYMLQDQTAFCVNGMFVKSLIFGSWETPNWIFDCLLEEIKFTNRLSENLGLPCFYRKEFTRNENEIIGYRILLLPTLKNYYDFISALEKIFINNINNKFFRKDVNGIAAVSQQKEDGREKGTLEMLEDWLAINFYKSSPEGVQIFKKSINKIFRELRKERQIPAHELYDNKYDKELYQKQNEWVQKIYAAVNGIRRILYKHPNNAFIEIPESIKDPNKIVIY